jgi:predicted ATPase/DNA-binding SARP family transcriptional activator
MGGRSPVDVLMGARMTAWIVPDRRSMTWVDDVLDVRCLGPVEVVTDEGVLDVGGPRERTVLAVLALAGGLVSQDRLIDDVWEGPPPASARKTLHTYVWRLRNALPAGVVATVARGYELRLASDTDVVRFERLVNDGADAIATGDMDRARTAFSAALELWRGEPFTGCSSSGALQAHAVRLDELRARAIEGRIDADLSLGRHADVIGELEEQVRSMPFRERGWELLVLALYRCGRQADALSAHRRARHVLVEQLGIEPGPALQELHRAILEQRPELAGSAERPLVARRLDAPPGRRIGRLPAATTPLVGRAAERHAVAELLEVHRLVTLIGVGGTGKTRLALAVGGERPPAADVVFCDLTTTTSSATVAHAVARAAGVTIEELALASRVGRDPLTVVIDHLDATDALVIVDNCEHVLDACAALVDRLLADCPGVRVLATSRERLAVPGEQTFVVPPLPVPVDEEDLRADAVTLFVQRATEARSGFTIGASNRSAVVEICRRLDGLPLALELAAARLSHLTPSDVADHLDRRFAVLGTTRGTRPNRHKTLQATIDWSYDLLTGEERQLFARLAVFAGWFRLDAVSACCAAGLGHHEVLDLLGGLVDQSLLVADHHGPATRYRFLETIRAYAEAKLATDDIDDTTRAAHCEWFLAQLEQIPWDERLLSPRLGQRLEDERDDVRRALRWADEHQRHDLVARLVASMAALLAFDGNTDEVQRWLAIAIEFERSRPPRERLATAASAFNLVYRWSGDLTALETHRSRLVLLVEHLPEQHPITAAANSALASLCARLPDQRAAMERYADLGLRHAPDDARRLQTMARCQKARALMFRGDHRGAMRVLEQGRAAAADDGYYVLDYDLALAYHLTGDHHRALSLIDATLADERCAPDLIRTVAIYGALAARATGDADRSRRFLRTSADVLAQHGHPSGRNDCLMAVGAFAAIDGDMPRAATILAGLEPTSLSVNALALLLEHYQAHVREAVSPATWTHAATTSSELDVDRIVDDELNASSLR